MSFNKIRFKKLFLYEIYSVVAASTCMKKNMLNIKVMPDEDNFYYSLSCLFANYEQDRKMI